MNIGATTFDLTSVAGSKRKTTGSYYTRSDLVDALLDSALEPVIELKIKNAELRKRTGDGGWKTERNESVFRQCARAGLALHPRVRCGMREWALFDCGGAPVGQALGDGAEWRGFALAVGVSGDAAGCD